MDWRTQLRRHRRGLSIVLGGVRRAGGRRAHRARRAQPASGRARRTRRGAHRPGRAPAPRPRTGRRGPRSPGAAPAAADEEAGGRLERAVAGRCAVVRVLLLTLVPRSPRPSADARNRHPPHPPSARLTSSGAAALVCPIPSTKEMGMMRALGGAVLVVAMAVGVAPGGGSVSDAPRVDGGGVSAGRRSPTIPRGPVAAVLERLLKQPVVVVNKAGRGGRGGLPDRGEQQARRVYRAHGARQRLRPARGRQALRAPAELHARSVHGHRPHQCRPVHAGGPRGHAVEDAQGPRRRRQEEAGRDRLQLLRPLRRGAHPDGDVHAGVRHQAAPPADDGRRADDERACSAVTRRR